MNFNDYENKLPYPSAEDHTKVYYYHAGKVVAKLKVGEKPEVLLTVKENVTNHEAYKAARGAYYTEENRLVDKFKHDVCVELGIVGNPKAEKLLSKAWAMGHSAGYSEIYNYACDLVDLIQD